MHPKHRWWASCVVALNLLLSSNIAVGGDALSIFTEDHPPLNYVENQELELVLEIENTFIYVAFNNETPDSIVDAW